MISYLSPNVVQIVGHTTLGLFAWIHIMKLLSGTSIMSHIRIPNQLFRIRTSMSLLFEWCRFLV